MSDEVSPQQWESFHDGRLKQLIAIALEAAEHTLKYFGSDALHVDAKSDDSPVTIADREAEQLARKQIESSFPSDTIQGEEFAERDGDSSYRWVIDPIDGTKSFICGVPLYSTLLALEFEGQPIAGAILIPALGEMVVAADGMGCWQSKWRRGEKPTSWKRARVSDRDALSRCVFLTSQVDSFDDRGAGSAYKTLERECWITRTWGDGYGYLLVATGRADAMVDAICNPWDVAAILPVVVEAGGRFTDWKGNPTARGGDGLGTNGLIHEQVTRILACD